MSVLIDTGPLVAMIDKNDQYHEWVVEQTLVLDPPFYTCEAVITEACFLVTNSGFSANRILDLAQSGDLMVSYSLSENGNLKAVQSILDKYQDLPASFADACLLRMAGTSRGAELFTTDNDFHIYRTPEGTPLSLIIPS